MLRGRSANAPGKIKIQWVTMNLPYDRIQIALNKKTLTSRNLPRLLNILQSSLGFLPGIICGLESLDEFGFFQ